MTHVVLSDIHLGSEQCRIEFFLQVLERLPPAVTLILNGDIIDRRDRPLPAAHQRALDRVRDEASRRLVIWVRGNHDSTYDLADPGAIQFCESHVIEKRLLIMHGHEFDNIMPYHRLFLFCFRMLHRLRVLLGAESVHVAQYAKRFPALYRVLLRSVAMNAIEAAREHGCPAVTCGHTHFVEDRVIEGIRYLNTGAWTEDNPQVVGITPTEVWMKPVAEVFRHG